MTFKNTLSGVFFFALPFSHASTKYLAWVL